MFFNLFVLDFIVLYLLPKGSSSVKWCPGWDGSSRMLWTFFRQQELFNSSKEWRGQLIIF